MTYRRIRQVYKMADFEVEEIEVKKRKLGGSDADSVVPVSKVVLNKPVVPSISKADNGDFNGDISSGGPSVDENNMKKSSDDSDSDVSAISDLSMDEFRWLDFPVSGPVEWIKRQMEQSVDPRDLLKEVLPPDCSIPEDVEDFVLWKSLLNFLMDPPKREKLESVNTIEDVIELIDKCEHIVVLTGAGVSVSCGIPDFRSKDGIYQKLSEEYPDLPNPQAMFDIHYFRENPKPFFKFAKEIYPGKFKPSLSHNFIKLLEERGKLLRNYTQNIDTLEQSAGIKNVIHCHGSFLTATCMNCRNRVDHTNIREDILNQVIPRCKECNNDEKAILKPDIVFFGESLSEEFHAQMEKDKTMCDLLIVIGSSLKVRPVSLIPNSLPEQVPQILINREPLKHMHFDVELLGNCDGVISELCNKLGPGWQSIGISEPLVQVQRDDMVTPPPSCNLTPDNTERAGTTDTSHIEEDPGKSTAIVPADSSSNDHVVPYPTQSSEMNYSPDILKQSARPSCPSPKHSQDLQTSKTIHEMSELKTGSSADEVEKLSTVPLSDHLENQPSPVTQSDNVDELKSLWKPRFVNLSQQLRDGTFLFIPPNRYIFQGAEFLQDLDEVYDDSSLDSDSMSHGSSTPNPQLISEEKYATEVKLNEGLVNLNKNRNTQETSDLCTETTHKEHSANTTDNIKLIINSNSTSQESSIGLDKSSNDG